VPIPLSHPSQEGKCAPRVDLADRSVQPAMAILQVKAAQVIVLPGKPAPDQPLPDKQAPEVAAPLDMVLLDIVLLDIVLLDIVLLDIVLWISGRLAGERRALPKSLRATAEAQAARSRKNWRKPFNPRVSPASPA
jgi:hypothetical protein